MKFVIKFRALLSQLLDERWRNFYWQRRFRDPVIREKKADRIALDRGGVLGINIDSQSKDAAKVLKTEGFLPLGSLLSPNQCAELVNYFSSKTVEDFYRPELKTFLPLSKDRHPHTNTGYHSPSDILTAPYLLELANDPKILKIAAAYFGCKPLISVVSAWWSYPTALGPQQAENFHRDVDDWRFLKLFLYLTNVETENGPHVFVRWSPQTDKLTAIKRLTDEDVIHTFGRQSIATITGKSGTAFLENTYGLHKGTPVESGSRLLFQVIYSLQPIPYGPKRPVISSSDLANNNDFDREINRVYISD